MTEELKQAENFLSKNDVTCVLIKDGILFCSEQMGIKPLLEWIEKDNEILKNAVVADKVIGKAAALIMVYGGVQEVYGNIMSEFAIKCFEKNDVAYYYGEKIPHILNRNRTDMCPMEKRCIEIDSPKAAFEMFKSL